MVIAAESIRGSSRPSGVRGILAASQAEIGVSDTPFGAYVEAVKIGNLLFLSGMLPIVGRKPRYVGRVGGALSAEEGRKAAELACLSALSAAKAHLGALDKITGVAKLGVYIATEGDFRDDPKVADGASELLVKVFGDGMLSSRIVLGVASFPPAGVHDLARVFRPVADGGRMARSGLVDIAASQEPDGREVFNNVRYGVFVTFKAHSEYARACFAQYGLPTDPSGWYASLWRPFHLIGLEASVSVLSAVLRNEATGSSREFRGDAVATAKKDMPSGEMLDGEGGFAVWAKAILAARSLELGALPMGGCPRWHSSARKQARTLLPPSPPQTARAIARRRAVSRRPPIPGRSPSARSCRPGAPPGRGGDQSKSRGVAAATYWNGSGCAHVQRHQRTEPAYLFRRFRDPLRIRPVRGIADASSHARELRLSRSC
jgi:enamine deaminase RidA (YjgF/YER057c/UK114 family)